MIYEIDYDLLKIFDRKNMIWRVVAGFHDWNADAESFGILFLSNE